VVDTGSTVVWTMCWSWIAVCSAALGFWTLIAQALDEGYTIVSRDDAFAAYGWPCFAHERVRLMGRRGRRLRHDPGATRAAVL